MVTKIGCIDLIQLCKLIHILHKYRCLHYLFEMMNPLLQARLSNLRKLDESVP